MYIASFGGIILEKIVHAHPADISFKCLPYQFSVVGYRGCTYHGRSEYSWDRRSIPEKEPEK